MDHLRYRSGVGEFPRFCDVNVPALTARVKDYFQDSSDVPPLLWHWWSTGEIPEDDFRLLLPLAWMMSGEADGAVKFDQWLKMFEHLAFFTDLDQFFSEGDSDLGQPPRDMRRLYRGHNVDCMRSFAWTDSVARAEWFAERNRKWGTPTFVFVADIPPEAILGVLTGRWPEREYVIHPNRLHGDATPRIMAP